MSQRAGVPTGDDGTAGTGSAPAPNRPSGLDGLLGTGPVFSGAVRGYDRTQVDDYVSWAETEVLVLRRENDHLLSRYAACSAELQNARRRLAQLVRERQSLPGPEDALAMVRRAEEEATAITAAAEEEAERVRADALTEAAARLSGVAEMREAVTALRDQTRSEAAAVLEAARREAAELGRAAAAERERLDREAAEARARADAEALERRRAAEAELQPLRDERDEARDWLRRLTGQLDEALAVVAGVLPDDVSVLADKRGAVCAEEGAAGASRGGDVSEVTPLHGAGRPEVAAAS
ncbi:DivIVA protein [Geodermatophilus amargosae]|uniref:DivIVA protein n=1 Tax=Geodermatophilus amargosae TaxID=1296565 RepID=A0A1I6YPH8_9ACTN|nr:DivIVA domain-containing protein [Geodermatophilus amargosae]SFT52345.1 DivIVA protein [Geodermatophilus amargosae]